MGIIESQIDSFAQQAVDCRMASWTRNGNRIVYGNVQAAGLLDRRELLRGLLTMAQNLQEDNQCVSVIVPKPSILLSTLHNHDKIVSSQMTWSDLFVFSSNIGDQMNSSVLKSSTNYSFDKMHRQPLVLQDVQQMYPSSIITSGGRNRQASFQNDMIAKTEKEKQHEQEQEKAAILVTTRPQEAVEHYLTIRNWTRASTMHFKQKWIWIWTLPYNSMRLELAKKLPNLLPLPAKLREQLGDSTTLSKSSEIGSSPSSLVVSDAPPDYVKELVDTMWTKHILNRLSPNLTPSQGLHDSNWVVGYLHIRRGDSVSRCDTSLPKMEKYLSCSLAEFAGVAPQGNTDHSNSGAEFAQALQAQKIPKKLILLFSTDEVDQSYRNGIRHIVEETLSGSSSNHEESPSQRVEDDYHSDRIGGYSIQLIDLDEFIRKELHKRVVVEKSGPKWWLENNYLLFRIQIEFQQPPYSSFLLDQRQRYHCNDCDLVSLSSI